MNRIMNMAGHANHYTVDNSAIYDHLVWLNSLDSSVMLVIFPNLGSLDGGL